MTGWFLMLILYYSYLIFLLRLLFWGICTVYDVTRPDTFTNLSEVWTKEIDLYSTNQDCIKMLVGNKLDKVYSTPSTSLPSHLSKKKKKKPQKPWHTYYFYVGCDRNLLIVMPFFFGLDKNKFSTFWTLFTVCCLMGLLDITTS